MSGASIDLYATVIGDVCTAGGGASAVSGIGAPPPVPGRTHSPALPSLPSGASLMSEWPLRDFLEFGVLRGAVPCARYHCRQVLWEWHLSELAGSTELVASELVTNAVIASRSVATGSPVRLWLLSDTARVLVAVWDASPQLPVQAAASTDAETGRGLLLVDAISDQWGAFPTPPSGKTVWALVAQ